MLAHAPLSPRDGELSARVNLHRELSSVPDWQSDLVRRVAERTALTNQDIKEVEANVLAPCAVALPHGRRLDLEDLTVDARENTSPRLLGIEHIESVGSLHSKAAITFASDGLTVIFGDNGSGKSSYARLLKEACRAVDGGETILPNVFAENAVGPGSYRLHVDLGDGPVLIERQADAPPEQSLASISVFDERCAELYVSRTMALPYVPRALRLLQRVAQVQETLRTKWQDERAELVRARPRFDALPMGTRARALMDGAAPGRKEIEVLATLSDTERTRLAELSRWVQDGESTARERETLERRRGELSKLIDSVEELAAAVCDSRVKAWQDQESAAAQLGAELETLGLTLDRMKLPGVGSTPWRNLWQAAAEYSKHELRDEHGDRCALCHQHLDDEAAMRMSELAAVAEGRLEADRAAAEQCASTARQQLESAADAARGLYDHTPLGTATGEAVRLFAKDVGCYLAAVLARESSPTSAPETAHAAAAIRVEMISNGSSREEYARLDDPDERPGLEAEVAELAAREALALRLDDAMLVARTGARLAVLDMLLAESGTKKLSTITRRLSSSLLAGRLGDELTRAREDLRICDLPVVLRSSARKGKAQSQLSLSSKSKAKLPQVLSAGERRALGLAYFLAEVAASGHDGAIVLDDPMSSLDESRRREVARRLVEESERRQVIVFTHDPGFFILLDRECARTRARMTVRTLRRTGQSSGHVTDERPYVIATAEQLAQRLRKRLNPLGKADREGAFDQYESLVSAFVDRLRKAWERLAAETLGGVVLPGAFDVHTRRLSQVVTDDALIERINQGMSATSFEVHDQGPTMSMRVWSMSTIRAELERFDQAVEYLAACRSKNRDCSPAAE